MKIIDHLAEVTLFKGLTRENLEELAMIVTDQEFKRGQVIFNEGDEGVGFFVVISGKIKIYKMSAEGKEQILHLPGPGETFAEVAVFTGSSYPAFAVTLEKSRLFFFPKKSFIDSISTNPSLAMNMLASLSMRLKRFSHMIEALSLKEVPGRLAAHLLYLSEQKDDTEVVLDITKVHLASLLGTIPETLSRILGKMTKQGLIQINGPHITILDPDGLEDLADGESRLT